MSNPTGPSDSRIVPALLVCLAAILVGWGLWQFTNESSEFVGNAAEEAPPAFPAYAHVFAVHERNTFFRVNMGGTLTDVGLIRDGVLYLRMSQVRFVQEEQFQRLLKDSDADYEKVKADWQKKLDDYNERHKNATATRPRRSRHLP